MLSQPGQGHVRQKDSIVVDLLRNSDHPQPLPALPGGPGPQWKELASTAGSATDWQVLLPGLRLTCKTPEASWLIYTSCQVHIHVHIDSAETQRSAMGNMATLGKPTGARPPVHLDRLFKVAESPGVRWDLRDELAQLLLVQLSHLSKNTTGLGPLAWTRAPSIGPGFPLRALHLFSRTNWTTLSFHDPFPTISSWKINVLLVAEQNHHIELLLTSFQV
ncbi:uncharacterized protein LOC114008796 [Tupaia chinensis]|uniref:uncharacterized protein LOC114008796 n=1 Tax=Tupaia chinensis TaxID=246437 RepID=UPI000FFC1C46|nr:uncharacterized protein LOC114008796 [Tupaia chinensis]